MAQDERREFERYMQLLKVSYSILAGEAATPYEFGECITLDISRKGVKLRLAQQLKTPSLVQLYIRVPNRSYGIFVLGKVLYCRPLKVEDSEDGWEAGIKFVGLLPPDLDQFITQILDESDWSEMDLH